MTPHAFYFPHVGNCTVDGKSTKPRAWERAGRPASQQASLSFHGNIHNN